MKRILVDSLPQAGTSFEPSEDESHHLARVRRARVGEVIEVLDGQGGLAKAQIASIEKNRVRLNVLQHLQEDREPKTKLHLVLAFPVQRSTFDQILPGLVQLGVHTVHLVETIHSGTYYAQREKLRSRYDRIANQALKQCGRLIPPQVHLHRELGEIVEDLQQELEQQWVLDPRAELSFSKVDRSHSVALYIGPEGGFHSDELAYLQRHRVHGVQLGPLVLRQETAALGGCFALLHT